MTAIRIWLLGLWECRSDLTSNPGDDWIETYDQGRAFGRRVLRLP